MRVNPEAVRRFRPVISVELLAAVAATARQGGDAPRGPPFDNATRSPRPAPLKVLMDRPQAPAAA